MAKIVRVGTLTVGYPFCYYQGDLKGVGKHENTLQFSARFAEAKQVNQYRAYEK